MHSHDDFRESLLRRITTSRAAERKVRARYEELAQELEVLARRRAAAEDLYRAEYGDIPEENMAVVTTPPQSSQRGQRVQRLQIPEAPDGPLTGLGWAEALQQVLGASSEPLHVKEIWRRLAEGGFKTEARDPLRSIVAMSLRSPQIIRAAPNTFALAEGKFAADGGESQE